MRENNASKLILIVDDEEKNVKLLADILQSEGYGVLKASHGEEAIAHLKAKDPDLIIADLNMPNLNGWRLGLWVMENKKAKKIFIIFLSALLDKEGPPGPGDLGDYYMSKPFDIQMLLRKIEEFLILPKEV